jgi:Phytanoyl-CoA dioxygenase (PhyH)
MQGRLMKKSVDIKHFHEFGWVRVRAAVPASHCEELVSILEGERGVPVHDASRWDEHGGEERDFVPTWGHQAQWNIRQHPRMHRIWTEIWGRPDLHVSLDSCRFTPPWKPGHAEPHAIHWDHDPWDEKTQMLQGVLALTDTAADQGGFRCVPSLYRDRAHWPSSPVIDERGDAGWLPDTRGHAIEHVPAQIGDLIVWDYRLPHGNSQNLSARPRLAFYISMHPAGDAALRQANIESWRTGYCVPWWRDRPGYDRRECWAPAKLSELGRKLLGLDAW